ncbi:MAG: 2-oxoacid:acceptor oxidoreductase family protein [Bacteroidota bacterium]|nr:2-oxoacid:acceptor oxidoreductase family protein [Bacteroidota bacterium]MDP4225433.1 2-oxoacid:acceptor oxidoreductase family protein [Bacteroidota bacterium]MDP4273475.1 2-oxoacid:acceptor oxidoreductase family protein [Bacteroidota bacterium]
MWSLNEKNEISVVISGEAGQGIQTLEDLLLMIMKSSGYHVFAYSEFMSRIRGGNNSMEIRITADPVQSFVDRIDLFIPLGADAVSRFKERITSDTLIISQLDYLSNSLDKSM